MEEWGEILFFKKKKKFFLTNFDQQNPKPCIPPPLNQPIHTFPNPGERKKFRHLSAVRSEVLFLRKREYHIQFPPQTPPPPTPFFFLSSTPPTQKERKTPFLVPLRVSSVLLEILNTRIEDLLVLHVGSEHVHFGGGVFFWRN